MLSDALIEQILTALPTRRIAVVGDLFLDRYLDIDDALTEPSIETGLDAYQVVRVRSYPGAAGTVINNLAALGVGTIRSIAFHGDDGEGYELQQALARLPAVQTRHGLLVAPSRFTPTYTKPILVRTGEQPRELNRLDIKNRTPTSLAIEKILVEYLDKIWNEVDALIVLDQVSEPNCGVVTDRMRTRIAELAQRDPAKFVLADSRERIREFRSVSIKPNAREAYIQNAGYAGDDLEMGPHLLADVNQKPVFCTDGERGICLFEPEVNGHKHVPAYPVTGPIDIVGAGDSTSAGIACAVMAGATYEQAAAFGNLVASITIQQIGVTGTATPAQVRERWSSLTGRVSEG